MVNIDISSTAEAQACPRGALGKLRSTRLGTKGRQLIAHVALLLGDLVTILLAGHLASLATNNWPRFAGADWYDLPLFIACCLVLGLYNFKGLNHDQRVRVRLHAVMLFTGIQLGLACLGIVPLAPAQWAICAALLFFIGFYVEHLVLGLLQVSRIWQAPKLIDYEGEANAAGALPGRETGVQTAAPLSQARTQSNPRGSDVLKRAIDLAVTVPAAILLLPLVGLMVLAIKVLDPGRAFYVQPRVGRDGRRLRIFKIRSMYVDADRRLEEHLRTNPAARAEWARYFKLRDDPRIIRYVGHFLRRSSLDELPQLWNVIRGDMTLVGPRPLPDYHAASFDEEFQRIRASVTPGLTGLCQVMARRSELDVQKVHDLYYIENWSIWLDLYILLGTIPAVMSARDAR